MSDFEIGQRVYDKSGRVYDFVCAKDDQAFVRQIYIGSGWEGEDELYPSDALESISLSSLHADAPVAKLEQSVIDAQNKLDELNSKIVEASQELRSAEKSQSALIEKLKKHNALSRIDDFLEGRMTHFVTGPTNDGKVNVSTFDEFMLSRNDYGRPDGDVKLLSLFGTCKNHPGHGNKNRDLDWMINKYRDGSGGWTLARPCLSLDEAVATATDIILGIWRDRDVERPWLLAGSIASADKIGMPVPDEIRAELEGFKAKKKREEIEKAEAALAVLKASAS